MASCEKEFPLSWAVWHNDTVTVRQLLREEGNRADLLEKRDPRGRTPLMLAVTLGHGECAKLLLKDGADANLENRGFWSTVNEAVATGDPELLMFVIQYRDYQRSSRAREAINRMLQKLEETPDFYSEMTWEFSSWVPFVSKMCPSDTYKIYKKGSSVRVDTTLVGFDSNEHWQRGKQTFLFRRASSDSTPEFLIIDHQRKEVFVQRRPSPNSSFTDSSSPVRDVERDALFHDSRPSAEEIATRLTSPIVTTYVDIERIGFERAKSGIPGWRSEKSEQINGYDCKVYDCSNIELVTKTRTEHLTEEDRKQTEARNATPIDSLLKFVQGTETRHSDATTSSDDVSHNPNGITPQDYFNAYVELGNRDIGRPKDISRRANSFKGTLWLSDHFPLSLQDQVTPIIDLMAGSSAHFARLKNFIELQLPAGFPVKIEIPLFHVISARITFGNVNASDKQAEHVSLVTSQGSSDAEMSATAVCRIDDAAFEVPADYHRFDADVAGDNTVGSRQPTTQPDRRRRMMAGYGGEEDDVYLQFAIQQSLIERGSSVATEERRTLTENAPAPAQLGGDAELQAAVRLSLTGGEDGGVNAVQLPPSTTGDAAVNELARVLELSRLEEQERQRRLEQQEEEQLQMALKMSLQES